MTVPQNFQAMGERYPKNQLFTALEGIIPDFSYPVDFYAEVQYFLFANRHSFFDEKHQPPALVTTLKQLSEEDQDNLLTVLEGAKGIIDEYKLKDMNAYDQLMIETKATRFATKNK